MLRFSTNGIRRATTACAAMILAHGAACGPSGDSARSNAGRTSASGDTTRATSAASAPSSPSATATPAAPAARVGVAQTTAHGSYLVDARGRALYLLDDERAAASRCDAMCPVVWPPFLAGTADPAPGNAAVQQRLLGRAALPSGNTQVTYAGHRLYYYLGDAKAGDTNGQHVEDSWGEWYLVSPTGGSVETDGRRTTSGGRRRRGADDR